MAVVEFGEGDVFVGDVEFAGLEGGGCGWVDVLIRGDCQCGDDRVCIVVLFEVVAEEV